MIDLGRNHHPFSAYFCCSMWPWCNPARPGPPLPNFSGSPGENESDPRLSWAGQGRPVSTRAALVAGSPSMGYILPSKWSHGWFIHKISGVRTKYFTFQCPTPHRSPHIPVRMNNLSLLWTSNHCKCRLSSIVSRLCTLATPIKFYPNQSWDLTEYLVLK